MKKNIGGIYVEKQAEMIGLYFFYRGQKGDDMMIFFIHQAISEY